jgi:hypothetical protein
MTLRKATNILLGLLLCSALSGCGGLTISETCNEPQAYQAVLPSERITIPDGLDPLDEFRELNIPEATAAPRPPGSKCIETPPSVLPTS